jgi:hypothetical protein
MKSSGLRLFDRVANSDRAPRVAEQVAHSGERMGEPGWDVKWPGAQLAAEGGVLGRHAAELPEREVRAAFAIGRASRTYARMVPPPSTLIT